MLGNKKDIVYKRLRANILSGKYPPMFKLPKELELAKELKVSRITVRPALEKLQKEGLIMRLPSKGTFVKGNAPENNFLIITSQTDVSTSPSVYLLQGINKEATEKEVNTTTCERNFIETLSVGRFTAYIKENGISGIIVLLHNFNGTEPILKLLKKAPVPIVIPHAFPADHEITGFAVTRVDERAGRIKALEYLAGKGHCRIATFIQGQAQSIRGLTPEEYDKILSGYNLDNDKKLIRSVPFDAEQIGAEVKNLMQISNPPSAILCYSDFFATHVYKALGQMRLRIPEDIAVMGTCGYPGAAFLDPPLSTIDYQYHFQGKTSVELLLKSKEWFGKNNLPPEIMVDTLLIKRKSTALNRKREKLTAYV